MVDRWQIRLLGRFGAERCGHSVTHFRTRKTLGLLAYLAHHSGRLYSREELASRLWPESPLESARSTLRVALLSIRRQLEPDGIPTGSVLLADATMVGLRTDALEVDSVIFDSLVDRAAAARSLDQQRRLLMDAANTYGGPLLPGMAEEWVHWERDRLGVRYLEVLHKLSDLAGEMGDTDDSLEYALRAVSLSPADEAGQARVIRGYVSAGRRTEALRQYKDFEDLLWREFERLPSPDLRTLIDPEETASNVKVLTRESTRPVAMVGGTLQQPAPAPYYIPPVPEAPTDLWLNRFFGRDRDVDWLERCHEDRSTRLITITGAGGVGKTRLAVEFARRVSTNPRVSTWVVQLANAAGMHEMLEEVARALQLYPLAGTDTKTDIIAALQDRSALLVLDGFEHLVDECAAAVEELLQHLPRLLCVVTSRRALELGCEQVYSLQPLAAPTGPLPASCLEELPSVQLFVDRARRAAPEFHVHQGNAGALAALVSRLEGIPLCLELAAGWARTLSPAEMLRRMDEPLRLLVSRRQDLPPRHRTVRATLEGSFALLPADLRRFARQLTVFRGGWTLDAAEAVSNDPDVLESLDRLRCSSIVQAGESSGRTRFSMLQIVREYLSAEAAGEALDECRARHALHFAQLAERLSGCLSNGHQAESLAILDEEQGNFRAALTWAVESDNVLTNRLVASLWRYWVMRGALRDGSRFSEAAAQNGEGCEPEVRARALNGSGVIAWELGDLALAKSRFGEALDLSQSCGAHATGAAALCNLGSLNLTLGEFDAARQQYSQALCIYRRVDDEAGIDRVSLNLGALEMQQGAFAAALPHLEESVHLNRKRGNVWGEAVALHNLAESLRRMKEVPGARCGFQQSLELWRRLDAPTRMAETLRCMGMLAADESNWTLAAALLGAGQHLGETSGAAIPAHEQDELRSALRRTHENLAPCAFQKAWSSLQVDELETPLLEALAKSGWR